MADLAAALERAERAGQPLKTLRGKHLAVLCDDPACRYIEALRRAAEDLGAQVTHIRPSDLLDAPRSTSQPMGNLLGRLYDAIDCHKLPADMVADLKRTSGKPVLNEIECGGGGAGVDEPAGRYLAQALLLSTLG